MLILFRIPLLWFRFFHIVKKIDNLFRRFLNDTNQIDLFVFAVSYYFGNSSS